MTTRKGTALIIFLIGFLMVTTALMLNLRINISDSMPHGLYREIKAPLKKGSLVEVCLPEPLAVFGLARHYLSPGSCPGHAEPVLKQVAGLAGDSIELTADYVAVNSKPLPHSATLKQDEASRVMPMIARGRYFLTANQVWLMGTRDAKSWDSRYYGAVDLHLIKSTIQPLVVW